MVIFNGYKHHKDILINKLSECLDMCDGYLGRISTHRHRIKLTSENARPIHSPPYLFGSQSSRFAGTKANRMQKQGVTGAPKTEYASFNVFAPNKDGSLRFRINQQEPSAVIICNSYPLTRTDQCVNFVGRCHNSFDSFRRPSCHGTARLI